VQAAVDTSGADQEPDQRLLRGAIPWRIAFSTSGWKDQIGYLGVERFGLGVHHRCEALPEPNLLDVEVVSQELSSCFKRTSCVLAPSSNPPQQIAQPASTRTARAS